ncbi:MAG: hypothetical protein U0003_02730 [Vampirovibrionales bacterium]
MSVFSSSANAPFPDDEMNQGPFASLGISYNGAAALPTASLEGLWQAIDAQLDADAVTPIPAELVLSDDTLWDTYADDPLSLADGVRAQFEAALPQWALAQTQIASRQQLIALLRAYAQRVQTVCSYGFYQEIPTPWVSIRGGGFFNNRLQPWTRSLAGVASIAALWWVMVGGTISELPLQMLGVQPNQGASAPSLLATAAAPSLESYVMTYCSEALVVPSGSEVSAAARSPQVLPNEAQVLMMGCGAVQ